jgi:hypothetical protein
MKHRRKNTGNAARPWSLMAKAAVIVAVAGLGVLGSVSTASAETHTGRLVYTAMHSAGFDANVAAAHGYEIRTTADGKQYSVLKGAADNVTPFNVVTGDCGRSWVWEDGVGSARVLLDTGFNVYTSTVGRQWNVILDDNGGTSTQGFSGGATGAYWDSSRTVGGLTRGPGYAHINSNGSNFAILSDGNVCYSGGPSDSTTIY